MRARMLMMLALLSAVAAASKAAAQEACASPLSDSALSVAGVDFGHNSIAEAKAIKTGDGRDAVQLTLTGEAQKRMTEVSTPLVGRPMQVRIDGRPMMSLIFPKPFHGARIAIMTASRGQAEAWADSLQPKCPG